MVTVAKVAGDKEGNCHGVKSDGNGDKGGGRVTAMRAMATKVVGKQQ